SRKPGRKPPPGSPLFTLTVIAKYGPIDFGARTLQLQVPETGRSSVFSVRREPEGRANPIRSPSAYGAKVPRRIGGKGLGSRRRIQRFTQFHYAVNRGKWLSQK